MHFFNISFKVWKNRKTNASNLKLMSNKKYNFLMGNKSRTK